MAVKAEQQVEAPVSRARVGWGWALAGQLSHRPSLSAPCRGRPAQKLLLLPGKGLRAAAQWSVCAAGKQTGKLGIFTMTVCFQ